MVKPYGNVSVVAAATRVIHSDKERTSLAIYNMSTTTTIYVGTDTAVTPLNGIPIYPSTGLHLNKGLGDRPDLEYYAISAAGAIDVRYLESFTPEEAG